MAKKLTSTIEKSSAAAKGGRPNFSALPVDELETESESDAPVAQAAVSSTPSKKSAARKRAQLRKADGAGASKSDAAGVAVPPVPVVMPPVGAKTGEKETREVESPAGVAGGHKERERDVVAAALDPKSLIDTEDQIPPMTTESVSSSDAETQPSYTDDEDDEEDDEEADVPAISVDDALATPTLGTSLTPSPAPSLSLLPPSPLPSPHPHAHSHPVTPVPYVGGADHDPKKKLQAIIQRTVAGILMVGCLVAIVCLGHVYVIVLVFVCQAVVFSELSSLFDAGYSSTQVVNGHNGVGGVEAESKREREREERRRGRREERDRWSRRISWYFFAATNYFLYGESLIYYFKHVLTLQASFLPATFSFAQHHRLISFGLYVIGFVSFVANLTRAQLRRQFGLFGWIHMSLLLVVVSSHFIVNSILEGLIWFWVPASLVIMNDIAAYVCGMLFGRHQLIKLSPKKTVEGFVGAFFVTIAFAVVWSTFFMRFEYMICPVQDLATNILSDFHCTPNDVFVWRSFLLPSWTVTALATITRRNITSIPWNPFQLHSIVMAIFASLVAPFGGFFASGFKRAFNIKDFGASIPGHGGVTDRMDCQFLMGLFSYVYYASLIRETHVTVGSILATVLAALSTDEQLQLVNDLGAILKSKGLKIIL